MTDDELEALIEEYAAHLFKACGIATSKREFRSILRRFACAIFKEQHDAREL
jgi:hypothetical protein